MLSSNHFDGYMEKNLNRHVEKKKYIKMRKIEKGKDCPYRLGVKSAVWNSKNGKTEIFHTIPHVL